MLPPQATQEDTERRWGGGGSDSCFKLESDVEGRQYVEFPYSEVASSCLLRWLENSSMVRRRSHASSYCAQVFVRVELCGYFLSWKIIDRSWLVLWSVRERIKSNDGGLYKLLKRLWEFKSFNKPISAFLLFDVSLQCFSVYSKLWWFLWSFCKGYERIKDFYEKL